jgi:hypothetical protein
MNFSEFRKCTALGMLLQVWETPEEFLNYKSEEWIEDSDRFYKEFDVSTFNISVDISHPSLTMLNYIYIVAELIAAGVSSVTQKRTLAMVSNLGVSIPLSIFEKGKEIKTFSNYYCEYLKDKTWIRKECLL